MFFNLSCYMKLLFLCFEDRFLYFGDHCEGFFIYSTTYSMFFSIPNLYLYLLICILHFLHFFSKSTFEYVFLMHLLNSILKPISLTDIMVFDYNFSFLFMVCNCNA